MQPRGFANPRTDLAQRDGNNSTQGSNKQCERVPRHRDVPLRHHSDMRRLGAFRVRLASLGIPGAGFFEMLVGRR